MKKEFSTSPINDNREMYGFKWQEHVLAIPSPIVLVTTLKDNGKNNATLQSWLTFTSGDDFYCIFASVNKNGHMYKNIKSNKQLVINFPDSSIYPKCSETIRHNKDEDDELELAGLTAEKSTMVSVPRVKECFLNLECEYVWEKDISSYSTVMCFKVLNVVMDNNYYNDSKLGRYNETGYIYNIHSPLNPETLEESETHLGMIKIRK